MPTLEDLISEYETKFRRVASDDHVILETLADYRIDVGKLKNCEAEIVLLLGAMADRTYAHRIDLLLIAAWTHPSLGYVENLCKILVLGDSSTPNDWIVDLLYKNPSSEAIPSLERAYRLKLPDDIYDEFGAKCLDALSAINTQQAWKIIYDAKADASPKLREHAARLTDWHNSR